MPQSQQQRLRNTIPQGPKRRARTQPVRATTPARTTAAATAPGPTIRQYSPTTTGKAAGSSVGTLEAEFFGAMVLVALTIFVDPKASSDYPSVMLAAMKRGTMIIISFFLLAMLSTAGPNAARAAKAFGALIIVALILAQAENGVISKMDAFFKSDWNSGGAGTGGDSSDAQAGTQQSVPGAGVVAAAAGEAGDLGEGAQAVISPNPFLEGNPTESIVGNVGAAIGKIGHGISSGIHFIIGG